MKTFSDYFAFSDFTPIYEHNQAKGEIDDVWRDKTQQLEETFIRSLHHFLTDFNREKGLKPVENGETHRTNFQHFWNAYINNSLDEKEQWHEISYNLKSLVGKSFHSAIFYATSNSNSNKERNAGKSDIEVMQETYDKVVAKIDKGDFEYFELPSENYCFHCGGHYVQKMENWNISLLSQHMGEKWTDRSTFTPAAPCEVELSVEKTIEFKTGNLILADWFRIPQFTEAVDNEDYDKHNFDVNCLKGRSDQAQYYLKEFNFISVSAWDDSHIYSNQDTFVFAPWASSMEESEHSFYDTFKDYGRVSKQLRALTIIEHETLAQILMRSGINEQEAQTIIKDYLKENSYEIQTMKVTPGSYRFQFSGNPHQLKSYLEDNPESEEKELLNSFPSDLTPNLIMKGIDLKPELKNSKKKKF